MVTLSTVTLGNLKEDVIRGRVDAVAQSTYQLLGRGMNPDRLLERALIPAMDEVGLRFETGTFFFPDMMSASRAMEKVLDILKPLLGESEGRRSRAVVALGTVRGDIHTFGKDLVAIMMRGAGFDVIDLGVDVPPSTFVRAAHRADVLGLSCLLSTTKPSVAHALSALRESGVRGSVKVIIGGSAVTESFADDIGADAYAPTAAQAVTRVRSLLGRSDGP